MDNGEKEKNVNAYVKYSSMGFQMLVVIGVFAFAGNKIDHYRGSKTPLFTALLSLIGVVISLYQVIRQLNDKK